MNTLSNDNIYPVGMSVSAKVNPAVTLIIDSYFQRIYYCSVIGNPEQKQIAYFERELIPGDKQTT
jgi:hypothetical protein